MARLNQVSESFETPDNILKSNLQNRREDRRGARSA